MIGLFNKNTIFFWALRAHWDTIGQYTLYLIYSTESSIFSGRFAPVWHPDFPYIMRIPYLFLRFFQALRACDIVFSNINFTIHSSYCCIYNQIVMYASASEWMTETDRAISLRSQEDKPLNSKLTDRLVVCNKTKVIIRKQSATQNHFDFRWRNAFLCVIISIAINNCVKLHAVEKVFAF